ncbi:MAG: CRTAC1 family protein [Verrucomicrobia bacterium]|nr:CRTAC1 family protein [Verrucomicrobiota bacterium]
MNGPISSQSPTPVAGGSSAHPTWPWLAWAVVTLALALMLSGCGRSSAPSPSPTGREPGGNEPDLDRMLSRLMAIEAKERQAAETVWAKEIAAQPAGRVFERLWDAFNGTSNRWEAVLACRADRWVLPQFDVPSQLPHGVLRWRVRPGDQVELTLAEWPAYGEGFARVGWEPVQLEFRHLSCELDAAQRPRRSRFYFAANLVHATSPERAALVGELAVAWAAERDPDGLPVPREIDATRVELRTRAGAPPFELVLEATVAPPAQSHFIDPLLLRDLDGDGRSEIILAARNLVYRWRSWDRFEAEALCRRDLGLIFTSVIADFDGDGWEDLLAAKFAGLVLFPGSAPGAFADPERPVWSVEPHLKYAQVLTCGDVDGDGDLDVWLGQYKGPYERGQMPTPYYDANDGHPAYLLLNDGRGNFTDATAAAGLSAKRWRRTYSGSLVDLDSDGDLDLLVVSDFAGVDLYANDGRGRFTDVTAERLPERHLFGMAHSFADFDGDGRLDFLVTGMHCPTALRLEAAGLGRLDRPDYTAMRPRMTVGNRLYLGRGAGRFEESALGQSVARSGWSWGCSAFDLDNDGHPDVYIGNGHESKQSVQDYDPEFWLHDLYVGDSQHDAVVWTYFQAKQGQTRGHGQSYGGYEKNRLYWNQAGRDFLEVGHLFGVALEQDSRAVATDDLDGDGRLDLLVTTFEAWPAARQTLRVYRNRLEGDSRWIAARLATRGAKTSAAGAVVTAHAGARRLVRPIVTGDSHRVQHADTVHFGLGGLGAVDRLEVRWPDGAVSAIESPELDRQHVVKPSTAARAAGAAELKAPASGGR